MRRPDALPLIFSLKPTRANVSELAQLTPQLSVISLVKDILRQ